MPPEAWGGNISVHSDQYSFAITWYEMRTGRLPFPSKNLLELAQQHLREAPDLSAVPEPEQQVLLRALAKKPEERFASCTAFVQALKEALTPPQQAVVPAQGFAVKAALGFVALALAVVVAAFFLNRGTPPPP